MLDWYFKTPYSAAATAALKAAFSAAQWAIIRDYGWEHPEIVGYMNAYAVEDAKIAYSLVEGIGYRWITGNNSSSYFVADIVLTNANWEFEAKMKIPDVTKDLVYIGCNVNRDRFYALHLYSGTIQCVNMSGAWDVSKYPKATISNNEIFKVVSKIGTDGTFSIKKNNNPESQKTGGIGYVGASMNLPIFGYSNGSTIMPRAEGMVTDGLWVKKNNEQIGILVPFVRNGQNELLNLVSGNLATRVGSFTISETPTS